MPLILAPHGPSVNAAIEGGRARVLQLKYPRTPRQIRMFGISSVDVSDSRPTLTL